MNDSFVFYKSFEETINEISDPLQQLACYKMLSKIAFSDEEIEINTMPHDVKMVYFVASQQIKASVKNKQNGAKGGRPKKEETTGKTKNPLLTPLNSNVNVNDNVNVNVNENVNEVLENTSENKETEKAPEYTLYKGGVIEKPVEKITYEYQKEIYNIFHNAGLINNNFGTFFQSGCIASGISAIKKNELSKNATLEDVKKACENYITVFTNSNKWYNQKYNFLTFCSCNQFYKFLPDNFVLENWIKKTDDKKETASSVHCESSYQWGNITYLEIVCPECNEKTIFYDDLMKKYTCTSCKRLFDKEELKM